MDEHGVIWAGPEEDSSEEDERRLVGHFEALEEAEKARLQAEAVAELERRAGLLQGSRPG